MASKKKQKQIADETGTETAVVPPVTVNPELQAVADTLATFDKMTLGNADETFRKAGDINTSDGMWRSVFLAGYRFGVLCRTATGPDKPNTCDVEKPFNAWVEEFYRKDRLGYGKQRKRPKDGSLKTMKSNVQRFADAGFNVYPFDTFEKIVQPVLAETNMSNSDRAAGLGALLTQCKVEPPTDEQWAKEITARHQKASGGKSELDPSLNQFCTGYAKKTTDLAGKLKGKTARDKAILWREIGERVAKLQQLVIENRKKGDEASSSLLRKIASLPTAEPAAPPAE